MTTLPLGAAPGPADPAAAAPLAPSARLWAIDAARGLALLGILLVNIQSFAEPFGRFMATAPESDDLPTAVAFYFVKIFCEGKFYPLFSLLFGIGLILQMNSVARSGGRSFAPLYLRRLLVLMLLGLTHALLLWYGDILFIYAFAGLFLMFARKLSGKVLLGIGVGLVLGAAVLGSAVGALMALGGPPPASAPASAPAEVSNAAPASDPPAESASTPPALSPAARLGEGFRTGKLQGPPDQPLWMSLETEAYRDGPWLDAFVFRAMTWGFFIIFGLLGFGWHVIGMFFIGAGLMKLGLFAPEHRRVRARLALIGLVVGVPAAIASSLLATTPPAPLRTFGASFLLFAGGPLVSLMYLCGISLLVDSGALTAVTRTLAAVGRMALTNYLSHTLICTFVFYHWGLAQFGLWTRTERLGLVFTIFLAQCIISPLWLSTFRFGPMEWLWRSLTYLRPQPMLRRTPQ